MKVEKINQNYSAIRREVKNSGAASIPNFAGSANLKNQIMEFIPNKKAINIMNKLTWLKGEIGGILITALGTGAVAPIFIASIILILEPRFLKKHYLPTLITVFISVIIFDILLVAIV